MSLIFIILYIKQMNKIARRIILSALLLFALPSPLLAQDPSPGQEPAAQAERFKTQTETEKKQLEKKEGKAPEIEIQPEQKKPSSLKGSSFILKKVTVTGATVFRDADFQPLYQPYLNKKITFEDIQSIIERIKTKYKEKGYLATTVYLPEQEIKEGKIEIRVMEGKMGKLNIEGNNYFSAELIREFFHLKKMKF